MFEAANPAADGQRTWYDFLAEARLRFPDLAIVVGGVERVCSARDLERLVVPIQGRDGARGWVAADSFLRGSDLPLGLTPDPLEQGAGAVYAQVLDHARRQRGDGEAIIAMRHLYMIGGAVSEESEPEILGGNQQARAARRSGASRAPPAWPRPRRAARGRRAPTRASSAGRRARGPRRSPQRRRTSARRRERATERAPQFHRGGRARVADHHARRVGVGIDLEEIAVGRKQAGVRPGGRREGIASEVGP